MKTISTIPLFEILSKYAAKHAVSFCGVESNAIIEAMQEYAEAYHETKMQQITDEDIEAWADGIADAGSLKDFERGEWLGIKEGARAFRDGGIKHNRKV